MSKGVGVEMEVGEVRTWDRYKVRDSLGNHVANAFVEVERERRRAASGLCEQGCSLWDCGREKGHAGPCAP